MKSNPTKQDSDGDGILDKDEFNWNGIDERYKNVNPLKVDTIEKLFPELSDEFYSKTSNKVYLSINDNDIDIVLILA